MPACPRCGTETVPPYRFCSACGQPLGAMPYPPYPPYPPPRKDNTALIVVIVVVVIVLAVALPAILYVMVSGLIGPGGPGAKPVITLTVTRIAGGVSILVAGIQPATSPSNIKVNIQNATSLATGLAMAMPTTSGSSVVVSVSGVWFTITWINVGGSGEISQGDSFMVTYSAAVGTQWSFLLIWALDGSIIPVNAQWQT